VRARLRRMIRAAGESARSAGQLLDHALVLYRADQTEEAQVDLAALLSGLARAYGPTAEMRDIALGLDLPEAPVTTRGDRLLIEAALRNLVDNAVKYSDPEGAITLTLATRGAMAEMQVADRGRGLDGAGARDLARRFHRGRNVGDVVGSGLGLTIVAEAAAAIGGDFRLEPNEGGGTCAIFCVPLR